MTFIIQLLIKTILETGYLTGVILIVGFFLGFLRNSSIRNFGRTFGNGAIMVTGFIGVPIHELSHAIIALLFGHKITKIKLLQKPDERGVMGYVNHSYKTNNLYQQAGNFFIGVAPIFGAAFSILGLMRLIIPSAYTSYAEILEESLKNSDINKEFLYRILDSYLDFLKVIFSVKNFENPLFYLFLFLSICISSHISLSRADIKGALKGLIVLFSIFLIINALNLSNNMIELGLIKYNIFITGILSISVLLSLLTFIISSIVGARR